MRRVVAALLVVVSCVAMHAGSTGPGSVGAQTSARGLLPQDYYQEVTVDEVAVSPAGTMLAFTVTTVVEAENRRHREVWIERLPDGVPDGHPVRFTDPQYDSSSPRWSPDGNTLSFTSARPNDANSTWFAAVLPLPGSRRHVAGVDAAPVWSPDGQWIAYVKADDQVRADAEDKRAGWIAADAVSHTLDASRFDGRVITTARYKRDGTLDLLPDPLSRKKRQIFVVAAGGGVPRRLTNVPFDVASAAWSRDCRLLVFSGDEHEGDEFNTQLSEDLYIVPRSGGPARAITANPGAERSAAWSPVADRLAFIAATSRSAKPNLFVADVRRDGRFASEPLNLTADWDLIPGAPFWSADGRTVRFEAEVRGNVHLFEVHAAGGSVRQVTAGDRTISSSSMSRDGQVLAYAVDDPLQPPEVFVARGDGTRERRATAFNDGWLEHVVRMPPDRLTWKVGDGTPIEGWVIKPVGFKAGRKYPLVLKIHGGPHSQYGNTWFDTFHVLSNAGMFVLYCNPRGSTGYGHRFLYATRGRWGDMDSEDFLKGIDAAIKRYPEIDPKRLGVSGGSYGGYMTNWLTARTTRFAAAVTSRSIANWESWYGASDSQGLTEFEFYGTPWQQRDLYRRLSPISYVESVRTPTLIIEGENDYRTPMDEGEQWFMALKKQKVPVELVRYPRSSHGLSRTGEPWLIVDRLERMRSWFVHWLGGASAPSVATQ